MSHASCLKCETTIEVAGEIVECSDCGAVMDVIQWRPLTLRLTNDEKAEENNETLHSSSIEGAPPELTSTARPHSNLQPSLHEVDPKYKGVGGWLLLFCIGLTLFSPLFTLASISKAYREASTYSVEFPNLMLATILFIGFEVCLSAFSIYAGIALWRVKENAVKTAKNYLAALLAYSILTIPLSLMAGLPPQANDAMVSALTTQIFRTFVYVVVWYFYLTRSRRVRATYAGEAL